MRAAPLVFLGLLLACFPAAGAPAPGPPARDTADPAPNRDAGPTIEATARFREGSAMTGGTANLDLAFTLPPGARIPDPPEVKGLGDKKALSVQRTDQGMALTLLVDSLDRFEVPALAVPFTAPDGAPGTIRSEPASITVESGLPRDPGNEDIAPIKDILPTGYPWTGPAALAGGALALLALAFAGWRLLRRKRRVTAITAELLPHLRARESLDRLARALEQGRLDDKAFYFGLSLAVREYMGSIRPFPALEMTTEEIASAAARPEDREIVRMLREADLVKFADLRPLASRKKEHLALSYGYVRDTAPAEPGAPAAGGREAA